MYNFSHATPEEKGLSSEYILNFHNRLKYKAVPIHSAIIFIDDAIVSEVYYSPLKKEDKHRMFSIMKTVTALGIGLLVDKGMLSLSDKIVDYFPEKLTGDEELLHPWLKSLTIENMLMMRTCHANSTYNKFDLSSDWVGSFFSTTPTHKPGTIFHYDTSASHVLAALIEKLTGRKVLDFVKDSFSELDIFNDAYCLTDGQGISQGGTGLVAKTSDLLKLGILLLNEGCINGKQLISREFIKKMTSKLTSNSVAAGLPSEAAGYGMTIWQTEFDGYVCYGMGGQYIFINPANKLILVTTADTQGYAGGTQQIHDAYHQEILSKLSNTNMSSASNCSAMKCTYGITHQNDNISNIENIDFINSQRLILQKKLRDFEDKCELITLKEGSADIQKNISFSYSLAQNNSNFNKVSINSDDEKGLITIEICNKEYTLPFGYGKCIEGVVPIYEKRCFGSATWLDESNLYIRFNIIDENVGSIHMQFCFSENDLVLFMKKIEETLYKEFNGHFNGTRL